MFDRAFAVFAFALILGAIQLPSQAQSPERLRATCLQGVTEIGKPGIPSGIALINAKGTALVAATTKSGAQVPVIALTKYEQGLVLVFAHDGYLGPQQLKRGVAKLLQNYFALGKPAQTFGVLGKARPREYFVAQDPNQRWVTIKPGQLKKVGPDCDVIFVTQGDLKSLAEAQWLGAFVAKGGKLVASGLIWGWRQLNPTKDYAREHLLNQALLPMGVYLDGGMIEKVVQPKESTASLLDSCSAAWALNHLTALKAKGKKATRLDPQATQAGSVLTSALRWLPHGDDSLLADCAALLKTDLKSAIPKTKTPMTPKQVFRRLALTFDHLVSLRAPQQQVKAAVSAADFPGQPNAQEKSQRITVSIDPRIPGWASTGVYARAGQSIHVDLGKEAIQKQLGLKLRIGCHKDELWRKEKWQRHPEVSRVWPLAKSNDAFASAHGGLVYIEIPQNKTTAAAKPFRVTIDGGYKALHFELGRTKLSNWNQDRKTLTAPWAELSNEFVTLTIRRESAAKLEDPRELLNFWREVLLLYPELGQRPLTKRPQRFVSDRQISAGYLHAGYPIMMQLVHSNEIVNLANLRDAPVDKSHGWGFWHELGHNHQQRPWTFQGTTEVTCNLFSLFVDEEIRKVEPAKHPWAKKHQTKIPAFLARGAPYKEWKKKPGIALWTYIYLQREFGWKTFQQVFAEYVKDKNSALPKKDGDKRDVFMVRMSRACKRDLGPYFARWGIPISQAARDKTKHLRPWMPKAPGFQMEGK